MTIEEFKDKKENCLGCKITAITGLIGFGGYIIYTARKYPKKSKMVATTIGAGNTLIKVLTLLYF